MIDRLGGFFGSRDVDEDFDDDIEDFDPVPEPPPSPVGQDERRMQVRAYNHWASLLGEFDLPLVADLDPDALPDFGPYSVLLDLTGDIDDPQLRFVGRELASEAGLTGACPALLSAVPGRSVLSRITDHYLQILANQAPIGFEAEFTGASGAALLYRGILLPYSSDRQTVDFIYGVINWKEIADQQTADELLLAIDQSLAMPEEADSGSERTLETAETLTRATREAAEAEVLELGVTHVLELRENLPSPAFGSMMPGADIDLDDEIGLDDEFAADLPSASMPAAAGGGGRVDALGNRVGANAPSDDDGLDDSGEFDSAIKTAADYGLPDWDDEEDEGDVDSVVDPLADEDTASSLVALVNRGDRTKKAIDLSLDGGGAAIPQAFEPAEPAPPPVPQAFEPAPGMPFDAEETAEPMGAEFSILAEKPGAPERDIFVPEHEAPAPQPADSAANEPPAGLYDSLAAAREMAQAAQNTEDRSRKTLYEAVGRAYDFSLAAQDNRADFEALLSDNGLVQQDRAPMTPVVKLVFGADYDKTRLTEYAAVLTHAHRRQVEPGGLASFLRQADGGLKGVVQEERRLRREEQGKPVEDSRVVRPALAQKLRDADALEMADLEEHDGAEFALVMVRRTPEGALEIIGEVPDDVPLVERAARKLLG